MSNMSQTLALNDHQCVCLTNQQADRENNGLSTVFTRSRPLPVRKIYPPKEKKWWYSWEKKANKRSDHANLIGK